jgi:Cd2+/Zn2+-exporting ATPase
MLQNLSEVDTIVFDKTGTLTTGNPSVVQAQEFGDDATQAWRLVATAEHESSHPLATAIVAHAQSRYGINPAHLPAVSETHVVAGKGIVATVDGHTLAIGNAALMAAESITVSSETDAAVRSWAAQGLSAVYAATDGQLSLVAGIGDAVRDTAATSLQLLRKRGIKHLIMLSGDGQETVDAIAGQLGLDEAHGGLLPQDKADFITRLQSQGRKVAFVGDGINDSPALVASDLGIAMGNGTATAVEISDVVLLNSDISKLPTAYSIARATVANTRENIGIALATVLFLFIGLFVGFIYMASGMLVHEASILIVVVNALRLLRKKLDANQV